MDRAGEEALSSWAAVAEPNRRIVLLSRTIHALTVACRDDIGREQPRLRREQWQAVNEIHHKLSGVVSELAAGRPAYPQDVLAAIVRDWARVAKLEEFVGGAMVRAFNALPGTDSPPA